MTDLPGKKTSEEVYLPATSISDTAMVRLVQGGLDWRTSWGDLRNFVLASLDLSTTSSLESRGGGIAATGAVNRDAWRDLVASSPAIRLLEGKTYDVAAVATSAAIHDHAPAQQPHVILPPTFKSLDGNFSTLRLTAGQGINFVPFRQGSYPTIDSALSGAVAAGSLTLPLVAGEGAKWAAGDWGLRKFGAFPLDTAEPTDWGWVQVRSVAGNTLTIDRPQPQAFDPSTVATYTDPFGNTNKNNKIVKWPMLDGVEIKNLTIQGVTTGGATEQGMYFIGLRNSRISGIRTSDVGTGINLQYCENVTISDTVCMRPNIFAPSVGRAFGLAECRNVEILRSVGVGGNAFVALEAGAEAVMRSCAYEAVGNPATGALYSNTILMVAGENSKLEVWDFTVTGLGGYVLAEVSNGVAAQDGVVQFKGRLLMVHPTEPNFRCDQFDCLLDYRIAGGRELYDFTRPEVWKSGKLVLSNGMDFVPYYGPTGPIRRARVRCSKNLTGTKLQSMYIGRVNNNGTDYAPKLVPGVWVEIVNATLGGTVGGGPWTNRAEQVKISITTETGSSMVGQNCFLEWEFEVVPDQLKADVAYLDT